MSAISAIFMLIQNEISYGTNLVVTKENFKGLATLELKFLK